MFLSCGLVLSRKATTLGLGLLTRSGIQQCFSRLGSNSVVANGERALPEHCYTFYTYRKERVASPTNDKLK